MHKNFNYFEGHVIKAFDMGVATMKLGERCFLTCAPNYAYGAAGSPPSIPPDSTLIFEVCGVIITFTLKFMNLLILTHIS